MEIFIKILIYLAISIGAIAILVMFFKARHKKKQIAWMQDQRYVILHILVPKDNDKSPVAAEQMFASLHGIFRTDERFQRQISFEIASKNKFIHFYVHVPIELKDFVEGQIYAQYPKVEMMEDAEYLNPDEIKNKKVVGAEIKLTKNEFFPIKTFMNFDVDPLAAITSVMAKVQEEEEICIQIIIRPVSDKWQARGISFIDKVRSGQPLGGGIWATFFKGFFGVIGEIMGSLAGRPAVPAAEVKLPGTLETALKDVEKKVTKLGFSTKMRVLVLAQDENTARAKIAMVGGVFKQFNTISLNGFELSKVFSGQEYLSQYLNREFYDNGFILNIEELASLFHLPSVSVETPNIVWAGSKKGEPPSNLPVEGKIKTDEITVFAKSNFRHIVHRFGIKTIDRRLHMYTIGKTGTGKSTMLENMIADDIMKGRGVAVVDPHGELINHILEFIPSSRINDVVYFNPADRDWPIGFNLLENVEPDLKNIVASGVVGIFKKIFTSGTAGAASWGPRLEYILRNVVLALLDYPNSTMLGIMKLLTDKDYRRKVIENVKDPVIHDFFINEFEKYDPKFRTEAIAPIQNKVGQFLSSSTIRNIVGQPKTTMDISKIMNEGKILLMDLSIGKIGEDNSALLGAMLITKIQLAAMSRASMAEAKRRDFYLYVDEFQNFATESFAVILSEARKYHLNLIMTNQYIAQMPEMVAKAVFGNVGTLICFRVGMQDATTLSKELEPVFEANDLVNLGNYHIYIKMAIDGVTRPAFSAVTLPPYSEKTDNKEKIVNSSRERYAKPRAFVEEKIQEWSEAHSSPTFHTKQQEKEDGLRNILEREAKRKNKAGEPEEIIDKKGEKWFVVPQTKPKIEDKSKSVLKPIVEEKLKSKKIKSLITAEDLKEFAKDKKTHQSSKKTDLDNFVPLSKAKK